MSRLCVLRSLVEGSRREVGFWVGEGPAPSGAALAREGGAFQIPALGALLLRVVRPSKYDRQTLSGNINLVP